MVGNLAFVSRNLQYNNCKHESVESTQNARLHKSIPIPTVLVVVRESTEIGRYKLQTLLWDTPKYILCTFAYSTYVNTEMYESNYYTSLERVAHDPVFTTSHEIHLLQSAEKNLIRGRYTMNMFTLGEL
jgi:hypothetical protein